MFDQGEYLGVIVKFGLSVARPAHTDEGGKRKTYWLKTR